VPVGVVMFSFWKNDAESGHGGRFWILLLLGAIGVGLLLFGGAWEKKDAQSPITQAPDAEEELREYQAYLEQRVKTLCESVNGVSNVTVIVTLSGSFQSVYATEWKEGDEKYVIVGSGANAEALLLSRATPSIEGIGVVCRGGGNDARRRELISLISAGFNLASNRIYVTEAQK